MFLSSIWNTAEERFHTRAGASEPSRKNELDFVTEKSSFYLKQHATLAYSSCLTCSIFMSHIDHHPVLKHGNLKAPINGGLNGKIL